MEDCWKKGLCKHLGVSNLGQKKLANLLESGAVKPEVNQVEAHPVNLNNKWALARFW